MTTTDANGVAFLETTDAISPFHTLMNGLQTATSTAINRVTTEMTSAARAAIVSPVRGKWIFETDTKAFAVHNGTVWRLWDTEWQTYTATLTGFAVGTVGGQVQQTLWKRSGDTMDIRYQFTFGSNGTVPTASGVVFSMPVPTSTFVKSVVGAGAILRPGSDLTYPSWVRIESSTTVRIAHGGPPLGNVIGTFPNATAWAAGDTMQGYLSATIA